MGKHVKTVLPPVVLRGDDAKSFIRRMMHPSEEEIAENKEILEKMSEDVQEIRKTDDGFEVVLPTLDLSFLEEMET